VNNGALAAIVVVAPFIAIVVGLVTMRMNRGTVMRPGSGLPAQNAPAVVRCPYCHRPMNEPTDDVNGGRHRG
jgi:hypothetical protein